MRLKGCIAALISGLSAMPGLADDGAWGSSAEKAERSSHVFAAFSGVWTLQDDAFEQVWDTQTLEQITIPQHITRCDPVNTEKTILCVVDAGGRKGHIVWGRGEGADQVVDLAPFGSSRLGSGRGTRDEEGNLQIRVTFSDEPEGTYRVYRYQWIDADRYDMRSDQYGADGTPTGNWYGGVFVRLTD